MPTHTSIRLPDDLKTWINARTILTNQSASGAIIALLRHFMDNDPLTALRIREHRGRYLVASAYTGETFIAFAAKDRAEDRARSVLSMIGADPANIIDDTTKEVA